MPEPASWGGVWVFGGLALGGSASWGGGCLPLGGGLPPGGVGVGVCFFGGRGVVSVCTEADPPPRTE